MFRCGKVIKNYDINLVSKLIDDEIDKYFSSLTLNIDNFVKKNDMYTLNKEYVLCEIFSKDFYMCITKLEFMIRRVIHNEEFVFNVSELEKDKLFNFNSEIISQYKNTYELSSRIEELVDESFEFGFFNNISNKIVELIVSEINYGEKIFSKIGMSSKTFNIKHKEDLYKRLKGIIINIKIRVKMTLKSHMIKYLEVQPIQPNIA